MKTLTFEKCELLLRNICSNSNSRCKSVNTISHIIYAFIARKTLGMINYEKIFDTSKAYKSALNSIDASLKYDLKILNLEDEILSSVIQMYNLRKTIFKGPSYENLYRVFVFAYHT